MAKELTGDYRQFMDKDYFGAWDIPEGEDLVVEIEHAEINEVKNDRGSEKKLTVHLIDYKPLIVNATNGEAISKALGSKNVDKWKGKKIALYREHGHWFGKDGDAVRVRSEAPTEEVIICEECGSAIKAANGFTASQVAAYAKAQYGKKLCAACAKKAREAIENAAN